MKKILFLMLALTITGSCIFAQGKQKQAKTAEERTEKIYSKINEIVQLKEEQKLKVKDIILHREKARDADRKEYAGNNEGLKKSAEGRNQERDADLKANLTPEQYQKLMEHRQQMKQKYHEKKAKKEQIEEDTDL